MNEKNIYVINTHRLFNALNGKRRNKQLEEIDNPLIASKLGILFALKTNIYVNFKGEFVELNDPQLIALREILDQHFNVTMTSELRELVQTKEQINEEVSARATATAPDMPAKKGWLGRIKTLFKSKVQESHA